jgi:hypothetical protein
MDEPRIIDDAVLREIDEDRRQVETAAEHARARARVAQVDVEAAERRCRVLDAAREFSAARMGMTFEQATAEAEAEVARLEAAVIEADAEVERAKEHLRDLQGWQRIQQQIAAAPQAPPDEPRETEVIPDGTRP